MEHNKKSSLVSFVNLLHKVSIIKLETSKSKILNISCTEVFKVSIVSTLSSGKSTLINALIGQEILPSKNQACTGKTIAILDNNEAEEIVAHVLYKNNNYEKISNQITNVIESYQGLNEKSIKEIIIEGSIKGIHNTDCSLMLIDTPGVNNAGDLKHGIESMKYIEELDTGLIIYVLNAAQIGTNDELNYLKSIAEKLTGFPELELIFIINKMDNIDPEIEDPMTLIIKCHEYLSNIGFKSPQIIPVSSEAGLLFKKVLNQITLTLSEFHKFNSYLNMFEPKGYNLIEFATLDGRPRYNESVEVRGKEYSKSKLTLAIENTGLTLIESRIEEHLIKSQKYNIPKIIN